MRAQLKGPFLHLPHSSLWGKVEKSTNRWDRVQGENIRPEVMFAILVDSGWRELEAGGRKGNILMEMPPSVG